MESAGSSKPLTNGPGPNRARTFTVLKDVAVPILVALVIGAVAGLGAVLFHYLLKGGSLILWTTAEEIARVPVWLRLLVPAGAGLMAGLVICKWAPELKGPGVPHVMKALALEGGRIRHRVTILKTLVTSTLISAGASVGREGPIVQIGASIGSTISHFLSLNLERRRLAVACGAAAGMAATFQAPIAGTMFAVEILLFDLEVSSMSSIVISAVTGTVVARQILGERATIHPASFALVSHWELLVYFVLGIAAGIASLLIIWSLFGLPRLWKRVPGPEWIKPGIGGLLVGLIGLYIPQVLGVGYGEILKALNGQVLLSAALVLFFAKIAATSICISSGMSGGIFAPSLFVGAMLGTMVGGVAAHILPIHGLNPASYALVGMGAVVSGTTLAPMTAVLTIFELTYTYQVILPLMVACIPSLLLVRIFHGYSVYETKLLLEGINLVRGHEVNKLRNMRVADFMAPVHEVVYEDMPFTKLLELFEKSSFPHFPVLDRSGRLVGVVTVRDVKDFLIHPEKCPQNLRVRDVMTPNPVTIREDDNLETAFNIFALKGFSFLPVMLSKEPGKVVGILKEAEFLNAYHEQLAKERILARLSLFNLTNIRPIKNS